MSDVKIVQQKLWSNGHRVKRMPEGMGFDLIVDNKMRLKVVGVCEKVHTFSGFDVMAQVFDNPDGSKSVFFQNRTSGFVKNFKKISKGGEKK